MNERTYSDEQLNMFIDEQLDDFEKNDIQHALVEDEELRTRVCELKAVRELVSYAYESVPADHHEVQDRSAASRRSWLSIAASLLVMIGAVAGWYGNHAYQANAFMASSDDVFQYYKHSADAADNQRRIILHVTTGDVHAVSKALGEAEQLITSYREAGTPMKLDIITYRDGINMLRVGTSPYVKQIESLLAANDNVKIYACLRSIEKAMEKEGGDVVLMPQTVTAITAQQLITERLEKGWIYIKV